MTTAPAIALHGLTKRYGAFTAVDDVTLEIEPGSICGLLGPNGAGKTTTFKCLLGFTWPTSGSVSIEGSPLRVQTFESLAYVPERATHCTTVSRSSSISPSHRRSFRSYDDARARELLALFALDPRKRAGTLSKGMRTAVALVLAFSIRPRVLILDEPSSGLDPVHQRHVLDLMIDAAANGSAVLFSSHQVGQVERAADPGRDPEARAVSSSTARSTSSRRARRSSKRSLPAPCPISTGWRRTRASCASSKPARWCAR